MPPTATSIAVAQAEPDGYTLLLGIMAARQHWFEGEEDAAGGAPAAAGDGGGAEEAGHEHRA